MLWFDGSIAEAVNLSKQKNAIFVVFVEGENDLSTEMAETLRHGSVLNKLSNETNFLAIKLQSGSTSYTHFAQIYQFVPVPSLFFIGRNGTPLEVVCAGINPDNLAARIDRILEEHYKGNQLSPTSSTHNEVRDETTKLIEAEANTSQTQKRDGKPVPETSGEPLLKQQKIERDQSGQEYEVVCEGDVCVRRPIATPSTSREPMPLKPTEGVPHTSSVDLQKTEDTADQEEKMKKAKELIEVRRKEKAEKEKELEKQKELERRSVGQGVAELKKWQADQELKQIQEDRKREKMENNLARQRVLEQIAQDRAERKAREQPQVTSEQIQSVQPPSLLPCAPGDVSGKTQIQFKLPDGVSHTASFDTDATISELHRYVRVNLMHQSSFSWSLWSAFPRSELVDQTASLRSLQLCPRAALLVVPKRELHSPSKINKYTAFITQFLAQLFASFVYQPSYQVYNWIRSRFAPSGGPSTQTRSNSTNISQSGQSLPSGQSGQGQSSGLRYRPRTNIHRLGGDSTNDDDNNTWNGNSTQQM